MGEIQFLIRVVIKNAGEIDTLCGEFDLTFQKASCFPKILNGDNEQPLNDCSFRSIFGRDKNSRFAIGLGPQRNGKNSFHRAHGTRERQFAHHDKVVELVGLDLFAGGEHCDRDR